MNSDMPGHTNKSHIKVLISFRPYQCCLGQNTFPIGLVGWQKNDNNSHMSSPCWCLYHCPLLIVQCGLKSQLAYIIYVCTISVTLRNAIISPVTFLIRVITMSVRSYTRCYYGCNETHPAPRAPRGASPKDQRSGTNRSHR